MSRLDAIRAWAGGNLLKGGNQPGGDGEVTSDAKQGVTFEHAKKLVALSTVKQKTVQTDILLKKYHLVETCRERRARIIHATKQEFLTIADSLPVDPEVKDLVRRRIASVLEKFASGYLPPTEGT